MSVAKSFDYETGLPAYQREAIEWLQGYRNTADLQWLLWRFRFAEDEVKEFRRVWARWLKLKVSTEEKMQRGVH